MHKAQRRYVLIVLPFTSLLTHSHTNSLTGRTEEIKNRVSPASLLWKSIFIVFLMLELVIPGYTLLYWNILYFLGQLFIVRTLNPNMMEVVYVPEDKGQDKKGLDTLDYFHERNPRKHELF